MNENDLGFFRTFLINQKSTLLNKTTEFKSEQCHEKTNISDEAEAASQDLANNLSIRLHERDRTTLYQIERALGKISEGTYGHCESCSQNIEVKRLKARPFASLCIDCMEEHEGTKYTH